MAAAIPAPVGTTQRGRAADCALHHEGKMTDDALGALAACLFMISLAMTAGLIWLELAAPWLMDMALGG